MQSTHDQAVLDAFGQMQKNSAEGALDTIVTRKTRVFFKDLREINRRVKDYDALSWISPRGEWVIFINKKHKSAPPEAIAAVIAHEAVHNDPYNSMNEEIVAWHQEAKVWMELKIQNPQLDSIPSGLYPLVDRLNELEKAYTGRTLEQLVRDNKGYIGLSDTSPGFMETEESAIDPYHSKEQLSQWADE